MTPPIEPEAEPLTKANVELIYEHTGERHLPACPFAIKYGQVSPNVCTCPHIVGVADSHDKLQATIDRLTRERDTWRQRAEEAEEVVGSLQLHNERLREALEAISDFGCDECGDAGDTCLDRFRLNHSQWCCQTCIALFALAPNTEGEEADG